MLTLFTVSLCPWGDRRYVESSSVAWLSGCLMWSLFFFAFLCFSGSTNPYQKAIIYHAHLIASWSASGPIFFNSGFSLFSSTLLTRSSLVSFECNSLLSMIFFLCRKMSLLEKSLLGTQVTARISGQLQSLSWNDISFNLIIVLAAFFSGLPALLFFVSPWNDWTLSKSVQ